MKHAEIVLTNGSHYVVIDGQEYSRHDSVEIAEAVRNELIKAELQREGQERGFGTAEGNAKKRKIEDQADRPLTCLEAGVPDVWRSRSSRRVAFMRFKRSVEHIIKDSLCRRETIGRLRIETQIPGRRSAAVTI